MAFFGRYHLKMDQKGRVRLPVGLSDEDFTQSLVITNSIYKSQRCLDVYLPSEWKNLVDKTSKLPQLDQHIQAFQRFYMASAQPISLDSHSRLLVPNNLREFASLDSQIVIIGMGHKFEIWSQTAWEKVFQDIESQYDSILQAVSALDKGKEGL